MVSLCRVVVPCEWNKGTTTRKRETIYIRTIKHTKKNQARYKKTNKFEGNKKLKACKRA
jgi:hypothetical protein